MSETKSPEVVCVGAANVDTIAVVRQMIGADERTVTERIVDGYGGPAATAAVALARENIDVAFCGVVGDDLPGTAVREQLVGEGIDTRWLTTLPQVVTTRTVVVVATETNTRTLFAGVYPSPAAADVPLDAAGWLHVDQVGFAPVIQALGRTAPDSRPRISLDAGNPIEGLTLSDVSLYAPTVEALRRRYPGLQVEDALEAAANEGPDTVVATAGSQGAWVYDSAGPRRIPSFAYDQLNSTLGAGDVFHGALMAGVLRGMGIDSAVRRASAVAVISCRALDGRSGIPTAQETDRFLQDAETTP